MSSEDPPGRSARRESGTDQGPPQIEQLEQRLDGLVDALRWTLDAAREDLGTTVGGETRDHGGDRQSSVRESGKERHERLVEAGGPIYDIAGVGASRLPAALLVEALNSSGLCARLLPLGEFAATGPTRPVRTATELIVFSQGLSPNARLALATAKNYRRVWLVTAVDHKSGDKKAELLKRLPSNVQVIRHAPAAESGSLLRVVGPLSACIVALLLAEQEAATYGAPVPLGLEHLDELPRLMGMPLEYEPWETDPLAWICAGLPTLTVESLAWAWQEGLRVPLAPAFDVLSFAHGPLQSIYERSGVIVLALGGGSMSIDWIDRVRGVLAPDRHRLCVVRSDLPPLIAPLVLHASAYRELLRQMRVRKVDPGHWPAQGSDVALYRLGDSLLLGR